MADGIVLSVIRRALIAGLRYSAKVLRLLGAPRAVICWFQAIDDFGTQHGDKRFVDAIQSE